MLIHREALELAKNVSPTGDRGPYSITCVNMTCVDSSDRSSLENGVG
jgi:hypothetical protein